MDDNVDFYMINHLLAAILFRAGRDEQNIVKLRLSLLMVALLGY